MKGFTERLRIFLLYAIIIPVVIAITNVILKHPLSEDVTKVIFAIGLFSYFIVCEIYDMKEELKQGDNNENQ
jgi:uncharacterized membrane protein (DUF485 family)